MFNIQTVYVPGSWRPYRQPDLQLAQCANLVSPGNPMEGLARLFGPANLTRINGAAAVYAGTAINRAMIPALPSLPAAETREVNLPFQGFYSSIWDGGIDSHVEQESEYWREDLARTAEIFPLLNLEEMEESDWIRLAELYSCDCINYSEVYAEMARAYAEEFGDWLADSLDLEGTSATFSAMESPRFYNFETDRVFANIALPILRDILARLLADDRGREVLEETIGDRHTSRSGFISFYSSDESEWLEKPLEGWDHNELGTLVRAWVSFNDVESIDEELYDWRPGGLYEEIYRAVDSATDWDKLAAVTIEQLR